MRTAPLAAALLLAAAPSFAEKPGPDFRGNFERTFAPHRSYGVVVQKGVPTTSVNGVQGNANGTGHFSIDIKDDSHWAVSQGLLDSNQTAVDFLEKGEVMELDSISYKDNRIDLRFVSTQTHKVTRGNVLIKTTHPEPVATNFKFFFPFAVFSAADVPKAVAFVSKWIRPFPSEDAARSFARGGGSTASTGGADTGKAGNKEIKVGMTALQVIDILGKPKDNVTFGNKEKWTYPDLTVLFENGHVTEVKF